MVRKFIEIKGKNYDLWEIKTIEDHKEFPEFGDDWQYYILLNREGIATNLNAVKILCDDEEDMFETIKDLKQRLFDDESINFI